MFVVDFCTASLVGLTPPKIVCSQARRLNTMIPGAEARYLKVLEEMMVRDTRTSNRQRMGYVWRKRHERNASSSRSGYANQGN